MKEKTAHWTKHTHLFRRDEYICSACRHISDRPREKCPGCGAAMKGVRKDTHWIDEMEAADSVID